MDSRKIGKQEVNETQRKDVGTSQNDFAPTRNFFTFINNFNQDVSASSSVYQSNLPSVERSNSPKIISFDLTNLPPLSLIDLSYFLHSHPELKLIEQGKVYQFEGKLYCFEQSLLRRNCSNSQENHYVVFNTDDKLGEGTYGKVYMGYGVLKLENNVYNFEKKELAVKAVALNDPYRLQVISEEQRYAPDYMHMKNPVVVQGQAYCVMAFMWGKDGDRSLFEGMPILTRFQAALNTIYCLMSLHTNRLVHGDIKPNNLIIDIHTLDIVIVDFGASRPANIPIYYPIGTIGYIAPEVFKNECTFASDVYSLGVTLTEFFGLDLDDLEAMMKREKITMADAIKKSSFKVFNGTPYEMLEPMLKTIIINMVATNPQKRPNLTKCADILENMKLEILAKDKNITANHEDASALAAGAKLNFILSGFLSKPLTLVTAHEIVATIKVELRNINTPAQFELFLQALNNPTFKFKDKETLIEFLNTQLQTYESAMNATKYLGAQFAKLFFKASDYQSSFENIVMFNNKLKKKEEKVMHQQRLKALASIPEVQVSYDELQNSLSSTRRVIPTHDKQKSNFRPY